VASVPLGQSQREPLGVVKGPTAARAGLPRFGTDGVRGLANEELVPEFVLALGRAAAKVLGRSAQASGDRRRGCFIVGRDTRRSGPMLQAALSAGLASEGADVIDVGIAPTPAVAYLSAEGSLPAAVISASHNPFFDNGIKFFAAGGLKLPDEVEQAIEAELGALVGGNFGAAPPPRGPGMPGWEDEVGVSGTSAHGPGPVPTREAVGVISSDGAALRRYESFVLGCLEGRSLNGLRVALDCANGAAWQSARKVFQAAGAQVAAVLGAAPDGTNINDNCGSTDPRALSRAVVASGSDLGLAFDGDADRVIAVDAAGEVVDGDRLLALFATDFAERGMLTGGTVVVTVMTNLGFHQAMERAGIKVHTVSVGDRYVLEALDSHGWALGGEQSGHIVFRSLATTGDGVLSGLLLADLVVRRGQPLASLARSSMERIPQVLRNVTVADRAALAEAEPVWEEVRRSQAELGQRGRVLLRPSGTEPVVRVMVEAPTQHEASSVAERLVNVLCSSLGTAGAEARS
jgi:phosphoglucosamine mutase